VGNDKAGEDITKALTTLSVMSGLITDTARPTTVKTRYGADQQQLLRADEELANPASAAMEQQLLARIKSAVTGCKVIILSDYAKGVLSPGVITEIIKLANAIGAQTLIDPKGRDYSLYKGATLLTPNRKELSEVAGSPIRTIEDAEKASRQLIASHNLQGV